MLSWLKTLSILIMVYFIAYTGLSLVEDRKYVSAPYWGGARQALGAVPYGDDLIWPWDVNGDGRTGILDIILVARHFGETIMTPSHPDPDVNDDGEIDMSDINLVGQHMGENSDQILKHWDFHESEGWTYGNEIINPRIDNSILEFTSAGSDPILSGPQYDPLPASNHQRLEIRLKSDSSGTWQFFYSNTNEGRYGGYSEGWSERWHVSASEDWQIISVSPFWKALGNTIKIRIDPANGHYQIDWIRIVEMEESASNVIWRSQSWYPDKNVKSLTIDNDLLTARASEGGAVFLTPVDIDSASAPILYFRSAGEDLGSFAFCWANDETPGLHTAGLALNPDGLMHATNVDLTGFSEWRGRIDVVGFTFGQVEGDKLILGDFGLSDSPQGAPELEIVSLVGEPVLRRAGQMMSLWAYLRNVGAETFPGGDASLIVPDSSETIDDVELPSLEFFEKTAAKWQFRPNEAGILPVQIHANGQVLSGSVRIEPAIDAAKADYVPEPQLVDTSPYEIGIYYFPGWSPDQWSRWEKQKGFPERDPVLGFYREGDPEVADWHIKWAVENGISFFMYDWYWRDGHIDLERGLEDGYLKAKYRDYLKFCVMWANHAGFADHSRGQLLTVTDYWIENYFQLDCYYKIDGKPVVSFFAPSNLTRDLDGSENVRTVFDSMRWRAQKAGLPGIYFIACGDNSLSSQERFKAEGYDAISAYNYARAGATSQRSSYESLMSGHVPIWNNSLSGDVLSYIPLLTVGWDSRPWHGEDALVRFGRSTEFFKEGLSAMKEWMDANDRKIGLLEAWNEWGEGSYIEPNTEFGFGDLEAIRSVFAQPDDWPQNIAPSDVGLGPYHIATLDHGE